MLVQLFALNILLTSGLCLRVGPVVHPPVVILQQMLGQTHPRIPVRIITPYNYYRSYNRDVPPAPIIDVVPLQTTCKVLSGLKKYANQIMKKMINALRSTASVGRIRVELETRRPPQPPSPPPPPPQPQPQPYTVVDVLPSEQTRQPLVSQAQIHDKLLPMVQSAISDIINKHNALVDVQPKNGAEVVQNAQNLDDLLDVQYETDTGKKVEISQMYLWTLLSKQEELNRIKTETALEKKMDAKLATLKGEISSLRAALCSQPTKNQELCHYLKYQQVDSSSSPVEMDVSLPRFVKKWVQGVTDNGKISMNKVLAKISKFPPLRNLPNLSKKIGRKAKRSLAQRIFPKMARALFFFKKVLL